MRNFYPNGTIVALKDQEPDKKYLVMIVGRLLRHPDVEGIVDYMGFIHPFGYQGLDKAICFSEDKIEKVIYEGYQDVMDEEFAEFLKLKLSEERNRT